MIDGDRRQMSGGQLHRVMKAGRAVWLDITRNHRAEGELAGERTYSARTQECVKSCQERSTNYLTGPTSLEMCEIMPRKIYKLLDRSDVVRDVEISHTPAIPPRSPARLTAVTAITSPSARMLAVKRR